MSNDRESDIAGHVAKAVGELLVEFVRDLKKDNMEFARELKRDNQEQHTLMVQRIEVLATRQQETEIWRSKITGMFTGVSLVYGVLIGVIGVILSFFKQSS